MKIAAWSPFQNTQVAVAWSGNTASVFAWDVASLNERIKSHGYDPDTCEVIPEAFIRQPGHEGVRLVACNDGVEAQVWSDGFMTTSRWWPSTPPQHEWALFARTTQASANTMIPALEEPPWLEHPWNGSHTSGNLVAGALKNKHLLLTAACVLLAPCFYFAAAWASYSFKNVAVDRQIAEVEEESRAIRIERASALSELEVAEDIIALRKYPHQLEIISRAHNLLREHSVTLSNWDYDDGTLEFGLESETDMDARVFIIAFENDPMFSSVSAGTQRNRLVLRMDVVALENIQL